MLGASIYLSEDINYNLAYLDQMHEYGVKTIFTSLHLEGVNSHDTRQKVEKISEKLRENNQELMVDISSKTMELFDLEFDQLKDFFKSLSIGALRIDYGFSIEEIEKLSRDFAIVLNASTIDVDYANNLKKAGLDLSKVIVCHNFYPRLDTGLSRESFREKNEFLKDLGFKIQAFIPGDKIRRGPFKEGLPTIEDQRDINPFLAYVELKEDFAIDEILLGDIAMSDEALANIMAFEKEKIINLKIKEIITMPEALKDMFYDIHTNRSDYSDRVVRSTITRVKIKEGIKAESNLKRDAGTITIDNEKYGRYNGELQITMVDLDEDVRVNVIGYLEDSYIGLLRYIKNKYKFRFIRS